MTSSPEKSFRKNQRERLLNLLESAGGREVSLPEILALNCAQYNARLYELRRAGHRIKNRTQWENGQLRSWFKLLKPESVEGGNGAANLRRPSVQYESQAIFPQFGNLACAPESRYPD